ncbi:hypothetical protein B0A55_04947 [Friedmanniomyces simplex]|uniref:Uncharacterized protein n=1 Tax=Friedmanniomyces simplex TaxID=329884 RepID=A0A4U0XDN4_9PEZI|nr:hypothetical protein B0A55_04947 [Friedmanniomyces simplex]
MIYAMVYEQARDFETAFRATWREDEEERQLRRNGKDYTPGRFHASFAENLVVSKQYFDEALPYLFNGKTMKLGCWLEVSMLALTKSPVDRYLYTAITSMDIDDARYVIPQNIKSLAAFPGLKTLKIPLDMDDAAILQRPHIQAFARVRGISHLQVTKIKPQDLEDSDIIAALYRNLDRAERIVRQLVSREQVISSVSDHPASIAEALAMAKEHEPHRRPSRLELGAQQPSEKLLQDADIPLTPDAFVPLFLSRPHDVLAWVKDALTRLAAQPATTNATS